MTPVQSTADQARGICQLLARRQFNIQDELSLQDGIEQVLKEAGIVYEREFRMDPRNRPDFRIGSILIEVKIKGTIAQFLRQADAYLADDRISELIAVGTPKWMPLVPASLRGKPIYTVRLLSSLL